MVFFGVGGDMSDVWKGPNEPQRHQIPISRNYEPRHAPRREPNTDLHSTIWYLLAARSDITSRVTCIALHDITSTRNRRD